jgi:hypothetical protein
MNDKAALMTEERLAFLETALDESNTVSATLREQLKWNSALQGEDLGWTKVFGLNTNLSTGPDLDELKEWSAKMRDALGNVHMQRGLRLRTNNIWSGGIHYSKSALPSGSGVRKQALKYVNDPLNRRNFFGAQAHAERESALYTDSIYLVLGDPSDYSLDQVALDSVGAVAFNPTRADEIIAYRIDFSDYSDSTVGVERKEWHYTDLAYERRNKKGFGINVQEGETGPDARQIFDQHVNTQIGWAFGVPDSFAAYAWAKVYRDFVMNGKVMSDAMAQFAFQIATGSKKETDNAAARIAQPSDAGATLIGANSLVPLPTAGKGYDFDSGRSLLAIVAAALEVSVISLSADPGSSGAYGSASTLDLPTRLAMGARRLLHVELDTRVLIWLGADDDIEVSFSSLEDAADEYREIQALVLALGTGLYLPGPIEKRISALLEIADNKVPAGWLQPVNKETSQFEADLNATPEPANPLISTPAPDQGQNSSAGGSDVNGNDIRSDGIPAA